MDIPKIPYQVISVLINVDMNRCGRCRPPMQVFGRKYVLIGNHYLDII